MGEREGKERGKGEIEGEREGREGGSKDGEEKERRNAYQIETAGLLQSAKVEGGRR